MGAWWESLSTAVGLWRTLYIHAEQQARSDASSSVPCDNSMRNFKYEMEYCVQLRKDVDLKN